MRLRLKQVSHLEQWIAVATRGLCDEARETVGAEMLHHFEATLQEAEREGLGFHLAYRQSLASLGDPRTARLGFRKVHLTRQEASNLRHSWLKMGACAAVGIASLHMGAVREDSILLLPVLFLYLAALRLVRHMAWPQFLMVHLGCIALLLIESLTKFSSFDLAQRYCVLALPLACLLIFEGEIRLRRKLALRQFRTPPA